MSIVVLAEKPSVARDIAAVLGANQRRGGWLEGGGYIVTWAVGHLVGLAQPHEIRDAWRRWDAADLPMLPEKFPLVVRQGVAEQLDVVAKLFLARSTREIVCATDAGREGELIFRLIYEAVGCSKPYSRLWISSLTPDAIKLGFRTLKPGTAFDNLAAAARARSEADWLVGMNLSRAYSLVTGEKLNVGRVKTPTLAMVVACDLAISNFTPVPYREVEVKFSTEVGEVVGTYVRADYNPKGEPVLNARLPSASERVTDPLLSAEQIVDRARRGTACVKHVEENTTAQLPPPLFDLTELQRVCNRLWGWTAQRTLDVAQELYERHKVLSYPRTDSRHLSRTVAEGLGVIVKVIRAPYEDLLAPQTGSAQLSRRWVDDAKVSDHHAIIPTATAPTAIAPGSEAAQLYDLVCRRLLSAWQPDSIEATTKVDFVISLAGSEDRYCARGKALLRPGWRALELTGKQRGAGAATLPAGLLKGMAASVAEARALNKETRPPAHFSEATLLSAMESAGASLEAELSDAMRERGLGTPATRAAIIEELVTKEYLRREGKSLRATPLGTLLVRRVHPHVASPAMTGDWEAKLRRIERGEGKAAGLLAEVRSFVEDSVRQALAQGVAPRTSRPAAHQDHKARPARQKQESNTRGSRHAR